MGAIHRQCMRQGMSGSEWERPFCITPSQQQSSLVTPPSEYHSWSGLLPGGTTSSQYHSLSVLLPGGTTPGRYHSMSVSLLVRAAVNRTQNTIVMETGSLFPIHYLFTLVNEMLINPGVPVISFDSV